MGAGRHGLAEETCKMVKYTEEVWECLELKKSMSPVVSPNDNISRNHPAGSAWVGFKIISAFPLICW